MRTPPDNDTFWHWLGYQVGSCIIPLLFLVGLPLLMIQACDAILAQDLEGPRCSEIVENLAEFPHGADVLREIGRAKILGGIDDLTVQMDPVDGAKCVHAAAAVKNDAGAQALLGSLYVLGMGVQQDLVLAHMWLSIAVLQGEQSAAETRDSLALLVLNDEQLDESRRRIQAWLESRPP